MNRYKPHCCPRCGTTCATCAKEKSQLKRDRDARLARYKKLRTNGASGPDAVRAVGYKPTSHLSSVAFASELDLQCGLRKRGPSRGGKSEGRVRGARRKCSTTGCKNDGIVQFDKLWVCESCFDTLIDGKTPVPA